MRGQPLHPVITLAEPLRQGVRAEVALHDEPRRPVIGEPAEPTQQQLVQRLLPDPHRRIRVQGTKAQRFGHLFRQARCHLGKFEPSRVGAGELDGTFVTVHSEHSGGWPVQPERARDRPVSTAEIEDRPVVVRPRHLGQQHPRTGIEPLAGEHSGIGGQLEREPGHLDRHGARPVLRVGLLVEIVPLRHHVRERYSALVATISTVKDPRIAAVRELATVAGRRSANRCLLEGELLIEQAIAARAELDFVLLAEHARVPARVRCPVHAVTPSVLKQALRTQKPVTALATARFPAEHGDRDYGELAVVLERIADPGNLGTIVRTACGLGAADVVLTDAEADLTSRRVLESSRAAVLGARPHRYTDPVEALDALHATGFEVVVTAPRGPVVQSIAPLTGGPLAVVVGNETDGVGEAVYRRADHVVRLPMASPVESLNVGVATGIALAELRARMLRASLPRRCAAATFPEPVRAALRARLGTLEHASAEEFEALVRAVAGTGPAQAPTNTLRERGWWDGGLTEHGAALLTALWPEYLACW